MWMKVLIVMAGTVLGSLVGRVTADISFLQWLSFGDRFGLAPATLDLGLVQLTFGFHLDITIAAALGLILAIVFCRRLL